MSEYRYDDLTGQWVVIAPSRRGLPVDAALRTGQNPPNATPTERPCPFCPGHEAETESTVAQITGTDGQWHVRTVRNRFPIVTSQSLPSLPTHPVNGGALAGTGIHEVIIEAREHHLDWPHYDPFHATRVLQMYRDRVRTLERIPGIQAVSLFRNRGRRAGSSQSHPHAQIVATTLLPPAIEQRSTIARRFFAAHRVTILESLLARELSEGVRIVECTDSFVVLCPFASHRSYETWIVPRMRSPSLTTLDDEVLTPLATVLVRTLRRVHAVTNGTDYNLSFRIPPPGSSGEPWACWHLEILPRMGGDAGFELTSGLDVVPVAPETAAAELREVR